MTATIFALATAPGRAAVAVMRLSGPGTGEAVGTICGPLPPPRRASLRRLKDADGVVLDEALVLWMPGPASFTGEDCAELHLHGGVAVVAAVSARLLALALAPAEPGAFTRRAFENGRIDLVQAEGVADLVDAETDVQRRQALQQLDGAASRAHEGWRDRLIAILARLEAAVDFPDEDLPEALATETRAPILALANDLRAAAAERRGETVREGFRVALLGAPNVGKSSLFNALLGRDAAIVTDIPGTTRDVIEAEMVLAGRRVILADLAGLRDATDPVEVEGVRRARAWGEAADLRLHLSLDAVPPDDGDADLGLWPKADLHASPDARAPISASTGEGLARLRAEIEYRAVRATTGAGPALVTRERHRRALLEAADALARAAALRDPELAAEEVRLAGRALERLAGRIDAEAVLGAVFSTFCIGK